MQVEQPQHLPLTLTRDTNPIPVMSSIARRKPIAYQSASVLDGGIDVSTTPPVIRYPTTKPAIPNGISTRAPTSPPSRLATAPSMTVPQPVYVTIPPHKDWYTMKPLPRPPLPLYHPNRVVKKPPPRSTSTALPLTRLIGTSPAPDPNINSQRTSGRNRRLPYKVREGGASGAPSPASSQEEKDGGALLEVPTPAKTRRPRRKKAEILAAAAAAAGEQEITVAARRKRRRAGDDSAANGDDNSVAEGGADNSGEPTPKKRRRRTKAEMGEAHRQQQENSIVSNYGTRSRAVGPRSGHRSASISDENISVDGDETGNGNLEASTEQGSVTPVPGNGRRRGRRVSPAETTQDASAADAEANDMEIETAEKTEQTTLDAEE